MLFQLLLSSFLALTSLPGARASSDYKEDLLLRPLPQNALLASFNFKSNSSSTSFDKQNFRYFPRSLGQILQHTHTKELHLRFSLGRWDDESWGERPHSGRREGGTGVEVWGWVEGKDDKESNSRWLALTNALSGLFCASLNFIDSTRTIRPLRSFEPEGIHSSMDNLQLLHGVLPHEVVCTENLTPFLKLLPCKGKAGISSLLDGHKLFDAAWQTMSIDVAPVCEASGECVLRMEQSVDMVLDISRSKRPRDNPIPRPVPISDIPCDTSKPYHADDSCFPLPQTSEAAWSLKEVFGRPIRGSCSLSSPLSETGTPAFGPPDETVCLSAPLERTVEVNSNVPTSSSTDIDNEMRCYELPPTADWDLSLPSQSLSQKTKLKTPRVTASRSINGYGAERGSILTTLTNPSPSHPITVVYLESLPWYMKPYLHTLRASLLGDVQAADESWEPLQETYYRPAKDRERGTHLEVVLTIPPASGVALSYEFEKAILRYTEYPPDANRGFDVAAAVVRVLPDAQNREDVYVRTTGLLLPLPTPDFSMPYNVIILTSTVMALGFGSIFNMLVRRIVAADEVPAAGLALAVAKLRTRIRSGTALLKGKIMSVVARIKGPGEVKKKQ